MTSYFALLGFVAIMVGTPGPANLLVMLAGVQRGILGSIGFICGLIFGKVILNIFIGLGFGFVLVTLYAPQGLGGLFDRFIQKGHNE